MPEGPVIAGLDALTTARTYEDDSRVVRVETSKRYASGWTAASIVVRMVDASLDEDLVSRSRRLWTA